MDTYKRALKSLGIMGPIFAGAALLANAWFGGGSILVEAGEPQAMIDAVTGMIDGGFTMFGLATGIYGRWRATTKVSLSGTAP